MLARTLFVGLTTLALLGVACSEAPPADETELTADELSSMVPGVDESALDRSVAPCDDFYDFACGGYIASLPADVVYESRSFGTLRKEQDALMEQVFEDVRTAPRTPAEKKASAYLTSCLATNNLESARPWIAARAATIDAATTAERRDEVLGELLREGVAGLFWIGGMTDTMRRGRHGTLVAMPSGFSWRTDYTTEPGRAERSAEIVRLYGTYEPNLPVAEAIHLANGVVEIEAALAKTGSAMDWEAAHPVGKPGLASAAPNVDWDRVFKGLRAPSRLGDFNVPSLEFFATVDHVLQTSAPDLVRAHLKTQLYGDFSPPPAEGVAMACKQIISYTMPDALEPRFLLYSGVDETARRKARGMFSAVIDAFTAGLKTNPFLDVPTRVEAEMKARKMKGAIGASRNLDDYADVELAAEGIFAENMARLTGRALDKGFAQIDRPLPLQDLDLPVSTVNATYDGMRNKINIPGGILDGAFFSGRASKVANFAGIGTVLAHEMTHGFDANGRNSDGDGVNRDWWTPASAAAFETRSTCLVDQYNAFPVDELVDPATGAGPHVDGKLTLSENIADSGIKFAYRASKAEERTGPMVAGFTPAQQFFIGYAQLWCSKRSAETATELLTQDSHSPPKARVNVPLRNFDAFAKAFSCAPKTAMAPANRCTMW